MKNKYCLKYAYVHEVENELKLKVFSLCNGIATKLYTCNEKNGNFEHPACEFYTLL